MQIHLIRQRRQSAESSIRLVNPVPSVNYSSKLYVFVLSERDHWSEWAAYSHTAFRWEACREAYWVCGSNVASGVSQLNSFLLNLFGFVKNCKRIHNLSVKSGFLRPVRYFILRPKKDQKTSRRVAVKTCFSPALNLKLSDASLKKGSRLIHLRGS